MSIYKLDTTEPCYEQIFYDMNFPSDIIDKIMMYNSLLSMQMTEEQKQEKMLYDALNSINISPPCYLEYVPQHKSKKEKLKDKIEDLIDEWATFKNELSEFFWNYIV